MGRWSISRLGFTRSADLVGGKASGNASSGWPFCLSGKASARGAGLRLGWVKCHNCLAALLSFCLGTGRQCIDFPLVCRVDLLAAEGERVLCVYKS